MRLRTLYFAMVLPMAAPGVCAQTARLGQAEILGRLAVSYSPSYVAYLVKTRGLNFSPTQDFIYRVKLAGGDGILVERLSANDSMPSVVPRRPARSFWRGQRRWLPICQSLIANWRRFPAHRRPA